MSENLTKHTFDQIQHQWNRLQQTIEARVEKTDHGWLFPNTSLALQSEALDIFKPQDIKQAENQFKVVHIRELTWVGNDWKEFERALADKIFLAIANALTPEGFIYQISRERNMGGGQTVNDHASFKAKLGDAIDQAQTLIKTHFKDKTKRVPFPYLKDTGTVSVLDTEDYADAVTITCHKVD